jgi:hypothetical protein
VQVRQGVSQVTPYWLSFTDGTHGCCEGGTLSAAIIKAEDILGKVVSGGKCLPYPAVPVIWQESYCPPFCYDPIRCAGKSSCPKDYACND